MTIITGIVIGILVGFWYHVLIYYPKIFESIEKEYMKMKIEGKLCDSCYKNLMEKEK